MKRYIVVTLQVEGIHYWPKCNIEEAIYLRNPHRHVFHITCKKEVDHNERDIEFICFKREILQYFERSFERYKGHNGTGYNFGSSSCESIAEVLMKYFALTTCKVLEDNENGAIIEDTE